jgi:8-hydroxy-5-deazaflavin:NADPH oxidoreductase
MSPSRKIAIVGGSGALGRGLALRLATAGHTVTLGSRDPERAAVVAADLTSTLKGKVVNATDYRSAVGGSEIIFLTVPYAAQRDSARTIQEFLGGKILVDTTVPLMPPKVGTVQLPEGGSAVAAIQEMLGDDVRVVSAFQNISAKHLGELDHKIDCDVLVCGNDLAASEIVIALCTDIGMRGIYAGPVRNSAAMEAMTSLLITINRRHKITDSGVRITGIPAL